ncbi:unnamed protein product [Ectocarpus sp. 12 AP-2014]
MSLENNVKVNVEKPSAVFICNSPLHVYNALQAAEHWGLNTSDCILVLKVVSDKIQLTSVLENLATWHTIIRIEPFPLPPRLKAKGNIKRYIQYKFFKRWQKELDIAKGCQYVFLCHNRQVDNRVIASYINARELIWLEDGTLSYFLWQEERLLPSEQRKKSNKPKAASKTTTTRNTKAVQNNRKNKSASPSKGSSVAVKNAATKKSGPVRASKKPVKSNVSGKPKPSISKSTINKKKPLSKGGAVRGKVAPVKKRSSLNSGKALNKNRGVKK